MAASYAVVADIIKYGVQAQALESVVDAEKQAALDAASSDAAGLLAKRYALPLLEWGTSITRRVVHLAVYDMLSVRGFNPQRGADANIQKRYDDAMKWFRDVSEGLVEPEGVVDSSSDLDEAAPLVDQGREAQWNVTTTGCQSENCDSFIKDCGC